MKNPEPKATPSNSRYVPLTQQPTCCVPTCIQIVMYKEGISLLPAEEIGYYLGLVVDPDRSKLFFNVRTAAMIPPAGYGIQLEPNAAFRGLGIPLLCTIRPVSDFKNANDLLDELISIESDNRNALLCFNYGALTGNDSINSGHVCVFDRVINGQIRIIDPNSHQPKWRLVTPEKMFSAMQKQGVQISAGLWLLTLIIPD